MKKILNIKLDKKSITTFILFYFILMFSFWDVRALIPIMFIILIKLFKDKSLYFNLTYMDVGILILLIVEIITALNSYYISNSLESITRVCFLFFLYLAYRTMFKKSRNKILFLTTFFLVSSILLLINVICFFCFYLDLESHGFTELNNFKNLYVFGLNSFWVTILLLFIPFNLVFLLQQESNKMRLFIVFNLCINLFCIVVSFSRGAYISLLVFYVLCNLFSFKYLRLKKIIFYNVIALLLLSPVFLVRDPFLTTLSFNKTISQQRSTKGRINLWNHTKKIIEEKPVFGWGQGNYVLSQDKTPYVGEDVRFSRGTNNTYIEILIERGIIGFFPYVLIFIIILLIFYKKLKSKKLAKDEKIIVIVLFSGIISILVRELTFSSMTLFNYPLFLTSHVFFLFIPFDQKIKKIKINSKRRIGFGVTLCVLFSIVLFFNCKQILAKGYNYQFVNAYNKNDFNKSLYFINKALSVSQNNILLNKHKALVLARKSLGIKILDNSTILETQQLSNDTLNISKKYFEKVLTFNPQDDEVLHNLGWIHFALGNEDSAKSYFDEALLLNPYVPAYHISSAIYNLKYSKNQNVTKSVSKAIRYSPEILDSKFYFIFSKYYPTLALKAKQNAIKELKAITKPEGSSIILKARLGRLLLSEEPLKALSLFEKVSTSVPNLSRPWAYRGLLNNNIRDSIKIQKLYKNAIFLNKTDYLTKKYYYDYQFSRAEPITDVQLKEVLELYKLQTSNNYRKNKVLSKSSSIKNSLIPNKLIYFIRSDIHANKLFQRLEKYYESINDYKLKEYYNGLSLKYKKELYTGMEKLQ